MFLDVNGIHNALYSCHEMALAGGNVGIVESTSFYTSGETLHQFPNFLPSLPQLPNFTSLSVKFKHLRVIQLLDSTFSDFIKNPRSHVV